ncbi:MAG: tetratricopeptide repeat protein [Bacteroidales bacterium]|nr:tetratricopeptide repeat protein [Bacteroidales bacterium]
MLHKRLDDRKMIGLFKVILVAITFVLYYNTIFNFFALDDYYINYHNPQIVKGIAGIPEIVTSLYADESGQTFGYRVLVRISFAIENQFTANWKYNPYFSHLINVLLYIGGLLLLYKVLRRLFGNYSVWFPFLAMVLFLSHPTHTEVVASLKNRDTLLNFIFSFLAIWQFIKWADTDKKKYVVFGMVYFFLALLSKETAIAQLAVFPLVLYFFTDISPKRLLRFSLVALTITIVALVGPWLFLPEFSREIRFFENPLVAEPNFMVRLSTSFYILGWYLKMLAYPYPLGYFYGYNMIPVVNWANIWVLLSFAAYIGMAVLAFLGLKKKTVLSFIILYYFITISMYANIVYPVPGIVGDRFMFFPSLAFSLALVFVFFKLFKVDVSNRKIPRGRLVGIVALTLLLLLPYGQYTRYRNYEWRTQLTLFHADRIHLFNSVKANELYGSELMQKVNVELAKPVNPFHFIVSMVDSAVMHYERAVELDSSHYGTWNNVGSVYAKIYANQALIRERSYRKKNELEKAEKEKKLAEEYFAKAENAFKMAIHFKPDYGSAYFNRGFALELQEKYDSAIYNYRKSVEIDGPYAKTLSRIANAYYKNGQLDLALAENKKIIRQFPESDLPYVNLGNYYYMMGETEQAIRLYEKAIEKGTNPAVGKLLSEYFSKQGNNAKAAYYLQKSKEATKKQED